MGAAKVKIKSRFAPKKGGKPPVFVAATLSGPAIRVLGPKSIRKTQLRLKMTV